MIKVFSALLLTTALLTPVKADDNEVVTIVLNTEFSYANMNEQLIEVHDLISDPQVREVDIIIGSPGGYTSVGEEFIRDLDILRSHGVVIKTSVREWAASMAADIFMEGDIRVIKSNDLILFHEIAQVFDGVQLSVSEVREIVNTGTLSQASHDSTFEYIQSSEGQRWVRSNMSDLQDALPQMESDEQRLDNVLSDRIGKSIEWVKKYLTIPFADTTYDGTQAQALGISTVLEAS